MYFIITSINLSLYFFFVITIKSTKHSTVTQKYRTKHQGVIHSVKPFDLVDMQNRTLLAYFVRSQPCFMRTSHFKTISEIFNGVLLASLNILLKCWIVDTGLFSSYIAARSRLNCCASESIWNMRNVCYMRIFMWLLLLLRSIVGFRFVT